MADAYAAGLVDGEGCLTIRDRRKTDGRRFFSPTLEIGMGAKAVMVLNRMRWQYGGTINLSRNATEKWQAAYMWKISDGRGICTIRRLLPYLRLKREQALVILEAEARFPRAQPGQKNPWTAKRLQSWERAKAEVQALNSKGPGLPNPEVFAQLVGDRFVTVTRDLMGERRVPYSQTWPKWGSLRNGECFLREPWAPATDASESSSWPTVTRAAGNGNVQTKENPLPGQTGGTTIGGAVEQWQTPVVPKGGGLVRGGDRSAEPLLAGQAATWPTPNANPEAPNNSLNRGNGVMRARNTSQCLGELTENWPHQQMTPAEAKRAPSGHTEAYWERMTREEAALGITPEMLSGNARWPTPTATDCEQAGGPNAGLTLNRAGQEWPTPAQRDFRTPNSQESQESRKHTGGEQLVNFVEHCLPQAQATNAGPPSLTNAPGSRRRLNPAFAAWLMGLPWWLTNSAHISCARSEMVSYRSKLQQQLSSFFADSESRKEAA